MSQEAALAEMRDTVALWFVGQCDAADIVYAACDVLANGLDGASLCELAAVSIHQADIEVPELLEPALHDLGIEYHVRQTPEAHHAGFVAMASRVLSGAIAPRRLTSFAYLTLAGHLRLNDETIELASPLSNLECDYEVAEIRGFADTSDIDAQVIDEARRIARPSSDESV